MSMESIIKRLDQIKDQNNVFSDWSLEDQKKMLDIYLIISKNEKHIFDLIYSYHGCDSWEDIFRDYDSNRLNDKTEGVEIAIEEITERISKRLK
jgi:hypothetical protein